MPVGMVVEQPRAEPHHPLEAEVVEEPLFDLVARQAVAVGVQQALLGRDHGARAIVVDRPALEHPVGLGEGQAGPRRQALADVLVALKLVLAAPAVEAEAAALVARVLLPSTIGPVSRSQMSPNGSAIDVGERRELSRALSAAPSCAATSRTDSPSPPAWTASANAATSRSAGLRSPSHSSGSLGNPIHTASWRRPFGERRGGRRRHRSAANRRIRLRQAGRQQG